MPGTVLLADPDERIASELSRILRERGWTVIESRGEKEALDLIAGGGIGMVIAPLWEPSLDGIGLLQTLSSSGGEKRPRVFFRAPAAQAEKWNSILQALGAEGVLSLPNDAREWGKTVDGMLEKADGGPLGAYDIDLQTLLPRLSRMAAGQSEEIMAEDFAQRCVQAQMKISSAAQRRVSLAEIGELILEAAVELTGSEAGWVIIRQDPASDEHLTLIHPEQLDRNALQLALSLVSEKLHEEVQTGGEFTEMWRTMGFQRLMVFPLSQGSVGWIGVANKGSSYSVVEKTFLDSLSVLLSIHYQQSQALYRAREAMDEAQAQFKAATLILPYEEPQVVARQVAQAVASFLGYPHCGVMLPAKDGKHLDVVGASGNMEKLKASLPLDGGGFTVKAFRTGRMVYSPNAPESPDYAPGWDGCKTELSLPLIHRNEILGVLDVESEQERAFQGKDLRILEAFAQRVSTLIYAARQHQSLTKTKERYHKLCEGSPLGLFTWNMNTGRIEEASLVVRSWMGDEVEGKLVESMLEPSSRRIWADWASLEANKHMPLTATIQMGATEGAPPVECVLTAYPGNGKLGIPGHAVLLARAAEPVQARALELEDLPAAAGPVVLCDPDAVWCAVTRIMLEDWGYTVSTAENLDEILDILERRPPVPALLVLDQSIPSAAPGRSLRAIRRDWPDIPVLVTGTHAPEFAETDNLRSLVKPYRMNEFRSVIVELLRRKE